MRLAVTIALAVLLSALLARAASGELSVKVIYWNSAKGELTLHLPMHNLRMECVAITNPAKPAGIVAGEYLKARLREGNALEIKGQIFRIEHITFL